MSNQQELETIETQQWADQLDALERLEKNPDFIKVVMEGYLKDKVLDSVSLLSHPEVKRQGNRGDVMEDLVAASNLRYHFQMVHMLGAGARADMEDEESPLSPE